MEQLVMSIAIPLAKQYGMNKALEIAYERLGIAAPKQSAVDILTGGGINQAFSPGSLTNMFKRGAIRLGANTLMKGAGSSILPIVGITGLAMFANKYRKQLTGYDTQAAYEAAREERIANKRLDKITDRIISGKNYGNYEDALLDSGAGAVKIDDSITYATDYFPETPKKKAYYDPPNIHNDNNNNNDNSGGNFASQNTGTNESFSNKTGKGRTGYGRGGIASL
jgi:hypothetical protein